MTAEEISKLDAADINIDNLPPGCVNHVVSCVRKQDEVIERTNATHRLVKVLLGISLAELGLQGSGSISAIVEGANTVVAMIKVFLA